MEAELQTTKTELQRYMDANQINSRQVGELQDQLYAVKAELAHERKDSESRIKDLIAQLGESRQFETSAEQLKQIIASRDAEIKELKNQISILEDQYEKSKQLQKADADALKIKCMDLQDEIGVLKGKLNTLNCKYSTSYTAEELAESFNNTINSFNSQMNSADKSVNYVINSMDVDLKAQLVRDDNQRVSFVSDVNGNGDSAMSTVKITIRAIPK